MDLNTMPDSVIFKKRKSSIWHGKELDEIYSSIKPLKFRET